MIRPNTPRGPPRPTGRHWSLFVVEGVTIMRTPIALAIAAFLAITTASPAHALGTKSLDITSSFCPGANDHIFVVEPAPGSTRVVMTGSVWCNNFTATKDWTTQLWYGYSFAGPGDATLVAKRNNAYAGVVYDEDTLYQCAAPDSQYHYWEARTTFEGGYRLPYGVWLKMKITSDTSCAPL